MSSNPDIQLIESLRARIGDVLTPLMNGVDRYAVVDYPNYPNVGDTAIWQGEMAALRAVSHARCVFTSDHGTQSHPALARCVGRGAILIHGGGNLGDVWPKHQACREEIIQEFPDNPIIQLPQTIHFDNLDNLARARRVFNAHPRLTLLVRDQRSLEIARNEFRATSLLCPDMALALGPLPRPSSPAAPVLWLVRGDKESTGEISSLPAGIECRDWLEDDPTLMLSLNTWMTHQIWDHPWVVPLLRRPLTWTYPVLARQRLQRGCALLASAKLVVTDRLHAHVLCLLLGIPHLLLDNRYGKLRTFYDTWTKTSALATWCDSLTTARALASPTDADPFRQETSSRRCA